MNNGYKPATAPTVARTTGPVKNVKDMLSGLKLADTPRQKASTREVVNKVTQSIAPKQVPSAGASTKKGSGQGGGFNPGSRMGHGFGGGSY